MNLLTIAGSDPSGAAGIQVDLQVFRDHGFHGLSVLTAVLAQNTQGVRAIDAVAADLVEDQLEALFEDVEIAGIKIGLLPDPAVVRAVARTLERDGRGRSLPVVLDPVLASGDGRTAFAGEATRAQMVESLFGFVDVLTPNALEAEVLVGSFESGGDEAILAAAERLRALGVGAVLLKAGHLRRPDQGEAPAEISDAFADVDGARWLRPLPRIDHDVRGTGCQLASAVCAALVAGHGAVAACEAARRYLAALLRDRRRSIGRGRDVIVRGGVRAPIDEAKA